VAKERHISGISNNEKFRKSGIDNQARRKYCGHETQKKVKTEA
jgi:hypothetical protein